MQQQARTAAILTSMTAGSYSMKYARILMLRVTCDIYSSLGNMPISRTFTLGLLNVTCGSSPNRSTVFFDGSGRGPLWGRRSLYPTKYLETDKHQTDE